MRKCTPDVRVTVAAVNRCNQVGASTRPLRPFFMEDVDDRPAISVERVIDSDALPVAISKYTQKPLLYTRIYVVDFFIQLTV